MEPGSRKRTLEDEATSSAKRPNTEITRSGVVRIATKSGRGVPGPKFPSIPGFTTIDCTSGSMNRVAGIPVKSQLSPMLIGPVKFKDDPEARVFENFWQYGKVFPALGHLRNGETTAAWEAWRNAGYRLPNGERHPKGTKTDRVKFVGADGKRRFEYLVPDFAVYGGEKMDYLTSRKKVYAPVYAQLIRDSEVFKELRKRVLAGENVQIVDLDGPRNGEERPSLVVTKEMLQEKINDVSRPFGHGYILAGLLAGIEPVEYCD